MTGAGVSLLGFKVDALFAQNGILSVFFEWIYLGQKRGGHAGFTMVGGKNGGKVGNWQVWRQSVAHVKFTQSHQSLQLESRVSPNSAKYSKLPYTSRCPQIAR